MICDVYYVSKTSKLHETECESLNVWNSIANTIWKCLATKNKQNW